MKVHFINLGCPKNVIDLENILGGLAKNCIIVADPNEADVSIVNTCAFIESAKEEALDSIFEIAEMKKTNPDLLILVTGCLPQRYRDKLICELPEVDGFFDSTDSAVTTRHIRRFLGFEESEKICRFRLSPRHYAYLKIAEGCDNRCSYCAIPAIKGPYRSRPFAEIVHEARQFAEDGVREIILVAQDTAYYGRDASMRHGLADILFALNGIPHLEWIRILYLHPAHLSDHLIRMIAQLDKVVKYVDLPIQHISDRLLDQMGRRVKRHHIESLIDRIRREIPDVALRTSLIVGFPGETQKEFRELAAFVEKTKFDRVGVFTYSSEEDTRAFDMHDNVRKKTKLMRQQEIMEIQAENSLRKNESLIGKELYVLVDELNMDERCAVGRTQWDAPEIDNSVKLPAAAPVGEFCRIKISAADVYDVSGSEWSRIEK